MTQMNYNRPNLGYEREPWHKAQAKKSSKKLQKLWDTAIKTETKFLSGKYWNQDISTILNNDPKYCIWILENQPYGVIAKQIIRHFNSHQTNQKGVKTRPARIL
jgi:hypothetical protein